MRLHVTGLPFAHTSRDLTVCAYTAKTAKFLKMMSARGWDIVLYGGSESRLEETDGRENVELVPIFDEDEKRSWFGDLPDNELPFTTGSWDGNSKPYVITNGRLVAEIGERYEYGDLVLLTGGLAQKGVTDALGPNYLACEWAVGYSGWFLPFACFESYAWQHYCYGKNGVKDGRWFDAVIPNFFDADDFRLAASKDGEYLLYLGRLIHRKGPHVAAEIARELDMPLIVAGPGMAEAHDGLIIATDGTRIEGDVTYVGTVGREERAALLGGARALLVPTTYIEPFGGVAVEAMMSGTPAVTTDWGAFTETVPASLRFRTLAQGCSAVEHAMSLPPAVIREQAVSRYSLEAVAPLFERWFNSLDMLHRGGWYERASRPSEKILT